MTFGPGSMLWESYGDRVGYLVAPRAGLLQLMNPDLGKGVEQHSAFYTEPWERLFRSVPQILATIFDGEGGEATAHRIREYHRDIKGAHEDGRRYHALDPDTYFWAHATFVDAAWTTLDRFTTTDLTLGQRRLYYRECVEWWRQYGLSLRPVPATYDDFMDYWNHQIDHVIERTPAADALVRMMRDPRLMDQPWIPKPLWRLAAPAGGRGAMWVAVGTMPPRVREIYDFPWTRADQAAFHVFRAAVARTWPLAPARLRYVTAAYAGYRRDGRLGMAAAIERAERRAAAGTPADAVA